MLIECLRRRTKGTVVSIGDAVYTFIPLPDGAHVCDVTHPDHIKRLLMVEAYVPYGPAATGAPVEEAPPPANVQPPRDLTIDPALFLGLQPGGVASAPSIKTGIVGAANAEQQSQPTIEGHAADSPDIAPVQGEAKSGAEDDPPASDDPAADEQSDASQGEEVSAAPDYAALTDEELAEAYEARFDKPPHNRMKRETIIGHLTKED
jgi:hypothetical protein